MNPTYQTDQDDNFDLDPDTNRSKLVEDENMESFKSAAERDLAFGGKTLEADEEDVEAELALRKEMVNNKIAKLDTALGNLIAKMAYTGLQVKRVRHMIKPYAYGLAIGAGALALFFIARKMIHNRALRQRVDEGLFIPASALFETQKVTKQSLLEDLKDLKELNH